MSTAVYVTTIAAAVTMTGVAVLVVGVIVREAARLVVRHRDHSR